MIGEGGEEKGKSVTMEGSDRSEGGVERECE